MRRFFKGPGGIELELNSQQPDVGYVRVGKEIDQYEAACLSGNLLGFQLTDEQRSWLHDKHTAYEAFVKEYTPKDPAHDIDTIVGPDIVCKTCGAHFNQHKPGCPDEP